MRPIHIDLFVEGAPAGKRQPVEVEPCGDDLYRILHTPGLVEGIAAKDVIRLEDPALGRFEVVERGGNVAVKWAAGVALGSSLDEADRILSELGARRDGAIERAAVWTVPYAGNFAAIEEAMRRIAALVPDSEWWFGNVYDRFGDPLGWWDVRP